MSPLFVSKGGGHMVTLHEIIDLAMLIVNIIGITAMLINKNVR